MTLSILAAGLSLAFQTAPAPQNPANLNPPAKPPAEKVFVTVNGASIKASDVEAYLWDWRANEVVQELIDQELIRTEAAKRKISVSDDEIRATLVRQFEAYRASLQPGQDPTATLQQQGFTTSRLAIKIRNQILVDKILEADFKPEDYVRVSTMIFRAKSESAADLSDALKRAEAAYQQLQKGSSWTKVLELNEADANVRQNGGQIGWRDYKAFTEIAANELRTLPVGKVSKPSVTQNGIQIFKVDAQGKTAGEVERTELRQRFLAAGRAQFMNKIRTEAKIVKTP